MNWLKKMLKKISSTGNERNGLVYNYDKSNYALKIIIPKYRDSGTWDLFVNTQEYIAILGMMRDDGLTGERGRSVFLRQGRDKFASDNRYEMDNVKPEHVDDVLYIILNVLDKHHSVRF